jgi:hypothetical protein
VLALLSTSPPTQQVRGLRDMVVRAKQLSGPGAVQAGIR